MKQPELRRILLVSAAAAFVMALTFSVFQVGVLGEDSRGGTHGEEDDKGYLEVRTSKEYYMIGEDIDLSITSHLDEAIIEPLPSIYNDDGETVGSWVRADVLPYPQLHPGQTMDICWDPWDHRDASELPPGRYYASVEYDGEEFIGEFWIFEPADTDMIPDGHVLENPFIIGPGA